MLTNVIRTIIFFSILLLWSLISKAEINTVQDKNFNETLMVCTTLDMYGAMALRSRESGMPLEVSTGLLVDSMNKNLTNLPQDSRYAYIDVVKDLYRRVYGDKSIQSKNVEQSIIAACSKYKEYQIDTVKLQKELSNYVQSAFDQFRRVPICQKAGETAANIAVARDKGIKKEEIIKVASSALENDQRTRDIVPEIAEEVYAFSDIQVASFYLYNMKRCLARQKGGSISSMKDIKARVIVCQNEDKKLRTECLDNAYFDK